MKIMNTYDPVGVQKNGDSVTFNVTGRKYVFDQKSVFPSSIMSQGKELLSAPITVKAQVSGKECVFSPSEIKIMSGGSEQSRTIIASMEGGELVVNAAHNVEFDGCDIINFTIAPRGVTPGSTEILYGKKWDSVFRLNNLSLEISLSKKNISYYQAYPFGEGALAWIKGKKQHIQNDVFSGAGLILEGGFETDFREQIYLHGDEVGLGFFFESDKEWNYNDKNKVFEVIDQQDSYLLRIHIFDAEPKKWLNKGTGDQFSRNVFPISIKFGMMATPIKPLEAMSYEKNIHIDCMKRFPEPHDVFLSGPIVKGDSEIGFDRLARLGVKTLYIHEKWNDIQNSVFLTEDTANRLRYIVTESHKRGMRVIPYFGFEISSLFPLFCEIGEKTRRILQVDSDRAIHWYRTPYQRAMAVCMNSEWSEILCAGLEALQEEYGFDGFYFDGTLEPRECLNSEHGCGYTDEHGNKHPTYPVFKVREFAKRIYRLASEKNLTINFHPSGCRNLAVLGFCSSLFEGEFIQSRVYKGELEEIPESNLRSIMDGTSSGVPVQALCYINPPYWNFHEAVGMMILHGSLPKTVCWEDGLEEMSKLWRVYDDFKTDGVEWKPYYAKNCPVKSETDGVRVSCYEKEDKILAIVATTKKSFSGSALIKTDYKTIYDGVSNSVISNNGSAKVELFGFDYKLLVIEK